LDGASDDANIATPDALSYGFFLKLGLDLAGFEPWIGIAFALILIFGALLLNRVYDKPARAWLAAKFSAGRSQVLKGATQAP
jgi:hypothetical protein